MEDWPLKNVKWIFSFVFLLYPDVSRVRSCECGRIHEDVISFLSPPVILPTHEEPPGHDVTPRLLRCASSRLVHCNQGRIKLKYRFFKSGQIFVFLFFSISFNFFFLIQRTDLIVGNKYVDKWLVSDSFRSLFRHFVKFFFKFLPLKWITRKWIF